MLVRGPLSTYPSKDMINTYQTIRCIFALLAIFAATRSTFAQLPGTSVTVESSIPIANGKATAAEGEYLGLLAYPNGGLATYQWTKNGTSIVGATDSYVEFRELKIEDGGAYAVTVTAGNRTVTSASIVVSIIGGLHVTGAPAGPIRLNEDVHFVLALDGGNATQIQWFHNSAPISGATTTGLSIPRAAFKDAGLYSVRAFHPVIGRYLKSSDIQLRVYTDIAPARIVVQPRNQIGFPGSVAVFSVGASGTPPFRYQWRKGSANIPNGTNFYLRLENLAAPHAGAYQCDVVGLTGSTVSSTPAALTIQNRPVANALADNLVTSGRAALTLYTNTGIAAAAASFATAIAVEKEHELANLFYGVVRVVNLVNQKAANAFLDRLSFSKTTRDLYHWSARLPEDTEHNLIAPPGVDTSEIVTFARTNLLIELKSALINLEQVKDAGFSVDLSKAETRSGAVTLDQGDLQLVRGAANLLEYFVRTLGAWNLSAQFTSLAELGQSKSLNIETLLRDHPELLTVADADQLAPAKAALESAVDAYVQGAGIIRSRPLGLTRLFNVDPPDQAAEERFRQALLDLKLSLAEVITVNEHPEFQVTLRQLVDKSVSPRTQLPMFKTNTPDPASLPDASYFDSISSVGPPTIIFQPVARSSFEIGVFAVGQEPLKFQWKMNGTNLPGATSPTLVFASAGVVGTNRIRVEVSNSMGSVTSKQLLVETRGGNLYWGARLTEDNLASIFLRGPAGVHVVIETSSDLKKWSRAVTNELPSNGMFAFPPIAAGREPAFYRAVAE